VKKTTIFPLERNHYFYGKLLTVRDFEQEQRYFNDKRRLINRIMLGTGIASGLGVAKSDDNTLLIESGMALDYLGREIVLPQPEIRSLSMLAGYEDLGENSQAYLCLRYDEEFRETVNAIGMAEAGEAQSNKCLETFKLYLTTQEPDVPAILDDSGQSHSAVLYRGNGILIVLSVPAAVAAGEEFAVDCILSKEAGILPASFQITFESSGITDLEGNNSVSLSFSEDPDDIRPQHYLSFRLTAGPMRDLLAPLANGAIEVEVHKGGERAVVSAEFSEDLYFAPNTELALRYIRRHKAFSSKWNGDLPIVLAKLDIIPTKAGAILKSVTENPFGQNVAAQNQGREGGGHGITEIRTEVDVLKYWQRPELQSLYNAATGALELRFGLPSNEANDYATASGVVNIPFEGGMKVSGRYFSEEIPHELGSGTVSVVLAVEFEDEDTQALLFGNGEVFQGRWRKKNVPQVELAAILYPERGTFRIGVWLMDSVEGAGIRVRYYVSRTTNDVEEMKKKNRVSIHVVPEVQRVRVRERLHMKAVVNGSDDKSVLWSVRDKNGGNIDHNGVYQAPDQSGTYEIIATSRADSNVAISAFVIVGE
jgi:hypothetical protein